MADPNAKPSSTKRPVIGVPILSPFAAGRPVAPGSFDAGAARIALGVVAVLAGGRPKRSGSAGPSSTLLLSSDATYLGQPVGLVLAEERPRAQAAAQELAEKLVQPAGSPSTSTSRAVRQAEPSPRDRDPRPQLAEKRGSPANAIAEAELKLKQTYRTAGTRPPLAELPTAIATFAGPHLTVQADVAPAQVEELRERVAQLLGIAAVQIEIQTRARWSTQSVEPLARAAALAALGAHEIQRPVEVTLPVAALGTLGETLQTLTLGATKDGELRGILHHGVVQLPRGEAAMPASGLVASALYACPNVEVSQHGVRLDLGAPVRRGDAGFEVGLFALETALDELAWLVGIDPLRFRTGNLIEAEPGSARPLGRLKKCYEQGAQAVGWSLRPQTERSPTARSSPARREGRYLVGLGMASAVLPLESQPGGRVILGAHFARVLCDEKTGEVRLARLVSVLDLFRDGGPASEAVALRTQKRARKAVVDGLERVLGGGLSFDLRTGRVAGAGDASLVHLRASELSTIEVQFLEPEPTGDGAKATAPVLAAADHAGCGVAPAIVNAVYAATGIRCRELPLRPEHLLRSGG